MTAYCLFSNLFCQGDVESNERFQSLQEELIAVKLREAESNLALRELVNHVAELDREWKVMARLFISILLFNVTLAEYGVVSTTQKQLERTPQDKLSKNPAQSLQEELMSCRLKAAEVSTANKQLRLRVTELETSAQISSNQVHRLMEENERLRREVSENRDRDHANQSEVEDLHNKLTVLESKVS